MITFTLPDPIPAALHQEVAALDPDEWFDAILDTLSGQEIDPASRDVFQGWFYPESQRRQDRRTGDAVPVMNDFSVVKAYFRTLLPKELLKVPSVRSILGPGAKGMPDLFDCLVGLSELIREIKVCEA
jgi:hypothetical protein